MYKMGNSTCWNALGTISHFGNSTRNSTSDRYYFTCMEMVPIGMQIQIEFDIRNLFHTALRTLDLHRQPRAHFTPDQHHL